MSQLHFAKPAQLPTKEEELDWELTVRTQSREELIQLMAYFIGGVRPTFFHRKKDMPIISVLGQNSGGKSMIIEAMMKQILDQLNPADMMVANAARSMFIERHSGEAGERYCYAAGTVAGKPVALGFDRITASSHSKEMFMNRLQREASSFVPNVAGAIFIADSVSKFNPWIEIDLEPISGHNWSKEVTLTINNDLLKSDPIFRARWSQLQQAVKKRNHKVFKVGRPESSLIFGEGYIKDKAMDPDLVALKMAWDNHTALGLHREAILDMVAKMSDLGQVARVRKFFETVSARSEDIISVVRKSLGSDILEHALNGNYDIDVEDVDRGLKSLGDAKKIYRYILRINRQKYIHDALDTYNEGNTALLLRAARQHLSDAKLEDFLGKSFTSAMGDRSKPVIQRLLEDRNFSEVANFYDGLSRKPRTIALLDKVSAAMNQAVAGVLIVEKGRKTPSGPIEPSA